jgi:hypothetical protein
MVNGRAAKLPFCYRKKIKNRTLHPTDSYEVGSLSLLPETLKKKL